MRKIHLLVALLALAITANSQDLYIRYDASCMDKLEYRFVEQTNGVSYFAYRLNKNAKEKLFFETGLESVAVTKTAPKNLLTCSKVTLTREDVMNINSDKKRVFLVKKLDSGYAILPVGAVSYMKSEGSTLSYVGPDFDLNADFSQPLSGTDLSQQTAESKSIIFYEGDMPACNSKAYLFKKSPRETCKEDAKIAILPSVGLVQEYLGGQTFELTSLNGQPVCDTQLPVSVAASEPKPEAIPQSYSNQPIKPVAKSDIFDEEVIPQPIVNSKSVPEPEPPMTTVDFQHVKEEPQFVSSNECNVEATEGEHVVLQGESLFGIARRYGLSVAQLREWNNLSSDLILSCTKLKIIPQIKEPEKAPTMSETRANVVPMSYKNEEKEEKEAAFTQKIDCNIDAKEGEHVVQHGESLYSISRKYNVGLEQLRSWNKLKNDVIYACMKLAIVAPVQPKAVVVTAKSVKEAPVPKSYDIVVKPKTTTQKETPSVTKAVSKPKSVEKKAVVKKAPTVAKTTTKKLETDKVAATYVKKGSGLYVVKQGETVELLAKRYGLTVTEFRKLNNLGATEKVSIGQVVKTEDCVCKTEDLAVPLSYNKITVQGKKEVVKQEDVPTSYATIVIPKATKIKEETEVTAKSPERRTRKYHVVQPDETLDVVSKKYDIPMEKLRKLNDLTKDEVIFKGQFLILE